VQEIGISKQARCTPNGEHYTKQTATVPVQAVRVVASDKLVKDGFQETQESNESQKQITKESR